MKPKSILAKSIATLLAGLTLNSALHALPQGAQVQSGAATFSQSGGALNIQTSDRAIINYQSFSIGGAERVNFIQPSAQSITLNRVTAPNPSEILGALTSNGKLVLANPYGIYFGPNSVINVGGLVAGAGHISDADFLAGRINFSSLSGDLVNRGNIIAVNDVGLYGAHVSNTGNITSQKGSVTLAAGSSVYVGEADGNIFVGTAPAAPAVIPKARVVSWPGGSRSGVNRTGSTTADAPRPAVKNSGTISAPKASLVAGDMYGIAIAQSGTIVSGDIAITGGKGGAVNVSGTLDASSRAAGRTGGSVKILGDNIALRSASVNVSGAAGGGTILVGGDYQGSGTVQRAKTTTVDASSRLSADAITSGNGGKVIVWSDETTSFSGAITAKGGAQGGSGGLVETSGKIALSLGAETSVVASAPSGRAGLWVIDPTDLNLDAVAVAPIVAALTAGTSVLTQTSAVGPDSGNITLSAPVVVPSTSAADVVWTLQAHGKIDLGAQTISLTPTAGNTASLVLDTATLSGLAPSHSITGTGGITASAVTANSAIVFGSVSLTGPVTAGTLNFNSIGSVTVNNIANAIGNFAVLPSTGSAITLSSGTTAAVGAGGITGTGPLSITTAGGVLAVNGNISTSGANNVFLQGAGVTQAGSSTVDAGAGTITVNGGAGTINMAGTLTTTNATGTAVTIQNATMVALGNVTAASGTVVLGVGQDITGAVTQNANTTINVSTVTASTAGSINLTASGTGANTIANLGAVTRGGALTVVDTAGGLNVTGAITSGTIANAVSITTAGGALAVNGSISTSGANNVFLQGAGVTQAGASTVNAGAGKITVNGGGGAIDMGTGTLTTTNATATAVDIQSATTVALGNVTATAGTLRLGTGDISGAVSQNAGTLNVSTITANTGGSIDLGTGSVSNQIGTLGTIIRGGALTVADSAGGLTVTGPVTAGTIANAVSITTAGGALAVNGSISTSGANNVFLQGAGVTQAGASTVNAGAGKITVNGGGGAIDMGTGTLTTTNATATAVDIQSATTVALGNVTATAGTLRLGTGDISGAVSQSAGTLNVSTITANTGGSIDLSTGSVSNQIGTLGTIIRGGALTVADSAGGLTVTGPVTAGTIANAVSITTAGGALAVNGSISTGGANNVFLQGAGVTQAATSTVNAGAGKITVNGGGGAIDMGTGTLTTTNATATAVDIQSATTVALGNVTATAGTLRLGTGDISGAVSQNAGTLNVSTITANTGGSIDLSTGSVSNQIGTLGTIIRGGALTVADSAGGLTVTGPITGGTIANAVSITTAGGALAVNGSISTSGANNVFLQGAGVTQAGASTVNAGTGTITINGGGGAINMGTGTLTTTNATVSAVTVRNATTVALGNVTAASGTLVIGVGADVTGAVSQNAASLIVNTITASTAGQDVTLGNPGNNVTVLGTIGIGLGKFTFTDNPVPAATLNVPGATVVADGGIIITNSNGPITTTGALASAGDITLVSSTGAITTGGTVTSTAGSVTLHANGALDTTAGLVSAIALAPNGNVTLISDTSTVTTGAVTAGNILTITLGPAKLLTVNGALTAPKLILNSDLMEITAAVGATTQTVTIAPVSAGQPIRLGSAAGADLPATLDIRAGEFANLLGAGVTSLTFGNATAGPISVAGPLALVTRDLTLTSGADITQTAGSGITTSGLLTANAGSSITLNDAANAFQNFAATFNNTNAGATTVDVVTNAPAGLFTGVISNGGLPVPVPPTSVSIQNTGGALTVNGAMTTDGGPIAIHSNGALTVNQAVNAGTASVTLTADTGNISQAVAGMLGGSALSATATLGSVLLDTAANNFASFTASAPAAAQAVRYRDADAFDIGLAGVAAGGLVALQSQNAAGTASGAITQTGAVTGTSLVVRAGQPGGSADLSTNVGNTPSVIAANVAGNFRYRNNVAAGLEVGTVDGILGITTPGAVTLVASQGDVKQTQAIIGPASSVSATSTLANVNLPLGTNAFTGLDGSAAIAFTATDSQSMIVGLTGVTATAGAVNLTTTGATSDLTVTGPVSGGTGVTLTAGGTLKLNVPLTTAGALNAFGTTIDINGAGNPTVQTSGGQTYNNPVMLTADAVLVDTGAGTIWFKNTVDSDAAITPRALTTNTTGSTQFDGIVGGTFKLSTLTVDNGAFLNTTAIKTTGTQTYGGAVTLGQNAVLTAGGLVKFVGTLNDTVADGSQSLQISGAGSSAEFDGIVGGAFKLSTLTVDNGAFLNTTAIKTTGAQTYGGAVTLGQNAVLTAGGLVKFGGTLNDTVADGSQSLQFSGAGSSAEFDGIVGGTFKLSTLTVDNGAFLNTTAIKTTGTQTYGGAVTLGQNAVLTAGGLVKFVGTLNDTVADGSQSLQISGAGSSAEFDGIVGGAFKLSTLTVDNGAFLNTTAIKTTGAQTYGGAVTLGQNAVLTAGGLVKFVGTLNDTVADGSQSLQFSGAGSSAEFDGIVGGIFKLSTLTVDNGAFLNTTAIKTTGAQTYGGAVTLGQNAVLTAGGLVKFGGTLNDTVADGSQSLQISGAGSSAEFDGIVGGTFKLSTLTVDNGAFLNTTAIKTTGTQTYGAAVTLGQNAVLTAGGLVKFVGTLNDTLADGSQSLQISGAGSSAEFDGIVGGIFKLSTLTVDNGAFLNTTAIKTTGAQTYGGAVTLGQNAVLTAGGLVKFGGTLNDTVADGSQSLQISGAGSSAEFDGIVGGTFKLSTLTVDNGAFLNTTAIKTTGTQTYGAAVTLGQNAVLTAGGLVKFGGTLNDTLADGSQSLQISGAGSSAEFDGIVGGAFKLSTLTVDNGTFLNTTAIKTTGAQTYGGAVTLGQNAVLTAGGLVKFGGTLNDTLADGSQSLQISGAGSSAEFDGIVGGVFKLSTLTVDNGAFLNTTAIKTTGTQTYGGAVTLGVGTTLSSGTGDVTFGATVIGPGSLTVSSPGVTRFSGVVGAVPLASLTTNGGGLTVFPTTVTTYGSQNIADAVTLTANTTLASTAGGSINLFATVDATGHSLTLSTAGNATLGATISNLSSLNPAVVGTTTIGTALTNTSISVPSALTFIGPVAVQGNVTLTTTPTGTSSEGVETTYYLPTIAGASSLQFNMTVDGPGTLTATSGGTLRFDGLVGSLSALGSLLATAPVIVLNSARTAGDLNVDAKSVTGSQNATDGLLLLTGSSYSSFGGSVYFNPTARATATEHATILSLSGNVAISAGATFYMGKEQKLLVDGGSLAISASTAYLGDMGAATQMNLTASAVYLQGRPVTGFHNSNRADGGLGFVSPTITFNTGSLAFTGGTTQKAVFSTRDSVASAPRISGVSFVIDSKIANQFGQQDVKVDAYSQPVNPAVVYGMKQPIASGTYVTDPGQAQLIFIFEIPKLVSLPEDTFLSQADKQILRDMGIYPRDATSDENITVSLRQGVFRQPIEGKAEMADPEFQVVLNRLTEEEIKLIIDKYTKLAGRKSEDLQKVALLLGQEVDKYHAASPGVSGIDGFTKWLQTQRGTDKSAEQLSQELDELAAVFVSVGRIGLTKKEIAICKLKICENLVTYLPGVTKEDILQLVEIGTKIAPPTQGPGVPPPPGGATPAGPPPVPEGQAPLPPPPPPPEPTTTPPGDAATTPTPGSGSVTPPPPPLPPPAPDAPGTPKPK